MSKQLLKNSLIYTVSSFAQKGLTFLLLPLYVHYLDAEEFGAVTIVLAVSYVSSVLFTLGLDSAIVRFYYDKEAGNSFQVFFGTILISILVIALVNYGLMVSLLRPVIQIFMGEIPFYPLGFIGLAILIFQPLYNFSLAFLQAKNEAARYALLSWLYFAINITLTVAFVILFQWKGVGYLSAILISQGIACVTALIMLRHEYRLAFRFRYFRQALGYSAPLIPHSLASQAASYADRFIINKNMDTSAVGVYQVGTVLSMPVELLAFSINRAFMPIFFSAAGEKDGLNAIRETSLIVMMVYLLAASLISVFCSEVIAVFFDPAFQPAVAVIPIIAFAYVSSGFYYLFSTVLFFDKRLTRYVPVCTVIGGVGTVVLNFLLVPLWGLTGAALSLFAGQFVLAFSAYLFSLKSDLIRWPLRKLLLAYLIFGSCVVMTYYLQNEINFWTNLPLKFLVVAAAVIITSKIYWGNWFALEHKIREFINSVRKK